MYLAIETSSSVCSVSVSNGSTVIDEKRSYQDQKQLRWVMPSLDELLRKNKINYSDLKGLAVSNGPGMYTGLRIGVSTVKTISQILNIPVYVFNSLDLLALNCQEQNGLFCPVIDVKKNQVFWSVYEICGKSIERKEEYHLTSFDTFVEKINRRTDEYSFIGSAFEKNEEKFKNIIMIGHKLLNRDFWYPYSSLMLTNINDRSISRRTDYLSLAVNYTREPDVGA